MDGRLWTPLPSSQGAGIETRAAHKTPDHRLGGYEIGVKCSQLCSQLVSLLWTRVDVFVEKCGLRGRCGASSRTRHEVSVDIFRHPDRSVSELLRDDLERHVHGDHDRGAGVS